MSWEDWLVNNGHIKGSTVYDRLLEMAVNSYDIRNKSRNQKLVDRKHFLVLWWKKHQDKLNTYRTMTSLSELIGFDHATVNHYEKHRKKSRDYEMNIECIKDFLE
jgi:maltooligosyltrehalose synthase